MFGKVQWLEAGNKAYHNEDFDRRVVLHNIKKYENHLSIIKIKNNISVKIHLSSSNTLSSVRQVTSNKLNSKISQHQKGVW